MYSHFSYKGEVAHDRDRESVEAAAHFICMIPGFKVKSPQSLNNIARLGEKALPNNWPKVSELVAGVSTPMGEFHLPDYGGCFGVIITWWIDRLSACLPKQCLLYDRLQDGTNRSTGYRVVGSDFFDPLILFLSEHQFRQRRLLHAFLNAIRLVVVSRRSKCPSWGFWFSISGALKVSPRRRVRHLYCPLALKRGIFCIMVTVSSLSALKFKFLHRTHERLENALAEYVDSECRSSGELNRLETYV